MEGGNSAYVLLLFGGFTGISRLLLLSGLVLAVANVGRFLAGRDAAAIAATDAASPFAGRGPLSRILRGGYPSVYWPLALVWLGFWIGGRFRTTPWAMAVGLLVLSTTAAGIHLVRLAHSRRGDTRVAGPAVAVVLSTAVLTLFGLLMTMRLVVVPDPTVGFVGGLDSAAREAGLWAVLVPASALALTLTAILVAVTGAHRRPFLAPAARAAGQTSGWFTRIRDRWERWAGGTGRHVVAMVTVVALFAAPLFDSGSHGLTFHGIATAEFGKIAYLWVLAGVLADYAFGYRTRPAGFGHDRNRRAALREFVLTRRHVLYPVTLFALVGITSAVKGDLGPMIPLFAGTLAMIVYSLRGELRRSPDIAGRRGLPRIRAQVRRSLHYSRSLWPPLAGILVLGVAVAFFTPYVSERREVWADPWVYSWSLDCLAPPPGTVPPPTPGGTDACQQQLASEVANRQSQIAQSLSVIADGGVWGRGLPDTASGRLPAGSTDFVLAVIWSKLGGLVVVLITAVLALLAAALSRTRRQLLIAQTGADHLDGRPTVLARLFVVGLIAVLLGQFVFVFAATVNAIPHSGITAPFLSRGGQSTIALGLGVIIAVAVIFRSAVPAGPSSNQAMRRKRPRLTPPSTAFAFCLALAIGVTLVPYSGYEQQRPFCPTLKPQVIPQECSTDRIAFDRTVVELRINGRPQYVRNHSQARWEPIGQPAISLVDLAGLLQVSSRSGGALDLALTDVVEGSSGTSLRARLAPPRDDGTARGIVDLAVDPEIQRTVATALRADNPDPLPAGIVVLDAATGHVLAAATTPSDLGVTTPSPGPIDEKVANEFAKEHPYGIRRADGDIDETRGGCPLIGSSAYQREHCWRWSLTPHRPAEPPEVNRALGRRYGLGSTFKVVVAAAYLRMPGHTADDRIAAPTTLTLGTHPIRNAGGGPCRGTVDGRITFAQALAVSCNTAFVALATEIGWPRIRDAAASFGFVVGPTDAALAGPAWLADTDLGVDSRVPETADEVSIGNNVLGGGQVEGTPLQMATVMGAIANAGTAVQPTLVTSITTPNDGESRSVVGESRVVLNPAQAGQLAAALSGTVKEGGTAAGLRASDGRPLWVKTGTHELFGGGEAPAGQFVLQISWLTGFLDTAAGRVAFAVAVETRDERAGRDRARVLAKQVIDVVTEVRG